MPDLTITGNIQVDGVAYQNGVVIAGSLWAEGDPSEFTVLGETTSDVSGNWTLTLVGRTAPVAVLVQVPSDRPKVFAPVFDGYDLDWDFDGAAPPAPEPPPEPPPDPEPPEPPPVPGIPEPLPVDMWTPEFTQVECWLHDEDSHVIVENQISAWLNRRPGSSTSVLDQDTFSQPDVSKRPTWDYLNLRPVVVFDGVDDVLPSPQLFSGGGNEYRSWDRLTYYMVVKHTTVPTTKEVVFAAQSVGGYNQFDDATLKPQVRIGAGDPSSKLFAEYAASPADVSMVATATAADATTDWHIRAVTADRFMLELQHYVNGALTPDITALPQTNAEFFGSRYIFLGASELETQHADVSIAEFIIVPSEETRDHHRRIEGYLAWKWGLQANLPVGHPYEIAYPTIPASWDYSVGTKDLWYDGMDADTIVLDAGSNISSWLDKSGTDKHLGQSDAALRPSWDQFTGRVGISGGKFLLGDGQIAFANAPEYTVYLAADSSSDGLGNFNCVLSAGRSSGTNNTELWYGYYGIGGETSFDYKQLATLPNGTGGGFYRAVDVLGHPTVTAWTTVLPTTSVWPPGGMHCTVNGGYSTWLGTFTWAGGDFEKVAVGGAWRPAPGIILYPMTGEVMEVLAFPETHSSDRRQRVEGALAWKWGFQTGLFAEHQYRWAPPYQEDIDNGADANFANVSLLLNLNDPPGARHFIDASPLQLRVQRFLQLGLTKPDPTYETQVGDPPHRRGPMYLRKDRSALGYLTVEDSAGFAFGTASFTVEFRLRPYHVTTSRFAFVGNAAVGTSNTTWEIGAPVGGGLYFRTHNTVLAEATFTGGFKSLGWVHVAVTFDGTTYRIFCNGALLASSAVVVNLSSQLGVWVGRSRGAEVYAAYEGIRYLRITKGIARYTAAFDPPTKPHPDYGP